MEQHPVPQDVTNFQFKLVGDMTLRQFGFLAAGCVAAFIFYSSNWYPIVKLPAALLSFIAGIAFAFVPIEERPMDTWVVNFFKSVYRPTQYIWKKNLSAFADIGVLTSQPPEEPEVLSTTTLPPDKTGNVQRLQDYLQTLPATVSQSAPPSESIPVENNLPSRDDILPVEQVTPVVTQTPAMPRKSDVNSNIPPVPSEKPDNPLNVDDLIKIRESELLNQQRKFERVTKEVTKDQPAKVVTVDNLVQLRQEQKTAANDPAAKLLSDYQKRLSETSSINQALAQELENLRKKISQLEKDTQLKEKNTSSFQEKLTKLSQNLDQTQKEKANLNRELVSLKRQLDVASRATPIKKVSEEDRLRFLQKDQAAQAPSGATSLPPNTVSGVVKNQGNQIIDNVIVLVKNAEGTPVRALRTNKLGQFLASTPLENGKYYIELEKTGYQFDLAEITLDGSILPPIEIKAK